MLLHAVDTRNTYDIQLRFYRSSSGLGEDMLPELEDYLIETHMKNGEGIVEVVEQEVNELIGYWYGEIEKVNNGEDGDLFSGLSEEEIDIGDEIVLTICPVT